MEPWLRGKDEVARRKEEDAEAHDQAGSPSHQLAQTRGWATIVNVRPRGSVAIAMRTRSPSPSEMRTSQWWMGPPAAGAGGHFGNRVLAVRAAGSPGGSIGPGAIRGRGSGNGSQGGASESAI